MKWNKLTTGDLTEKYAKSLHNKINDIDEEINQLRYQKHLLMLEEEKFKYTNIRGKNDSKDTALQL